MTKSRILRTILLTVIGASLLLMLPTPAAAQRFGFGFGFYGPVYPWGYYGPYPYAYYPYGYYGGRPLGEVHIKSPDSEAQIFINGALAGRAHDLKRFYLVPGTYNIEQRIGADVQKQRVYVIANRSLKVEFGKPGTANPAPPPPPPAPAEQPVPAPPTQSPQ
jgi:hypothetical protein